MGLDRPVALPAAAPVPLKTGTVELRAPVGRALERAERAELTAAVAVAAVVVLLDGLVADAVEVVMVRVDAQVEELAMNDEALVARVELLAGAEVELAATEVEEMAEVATTAA